MKKLLQDLKSLEVGKIEPNAIRELIRSHDLRNLNYEPYLESQELVAELNERSDTNGTQWSDMLP